VVDAGGYDDANAAGGEMPMHTSETGRLGFRLALGLMTALAGTVGMAQKLDLDASALVDLTHPYNAQTIYWPTEKAAFKLEPRSVGQSPGGFFYAAFAFCMPEHGGTHLDAPYHFGERQEPTDEIPLRRLMASAVVIDVTRSALKDRDYRVTQEDVLAFEKTQGRIGAGTIVLVRTGWSRHWPDRLAYLGDNTPGDASKLRFPGYGEDAARLLVEERQVAVLGIDTASVDYGRSTDFIVHRVAAARNVPNLENLTNLDRLPARGATVIALPMKIEGGSGGPARVVAVVPGK
jgi:kynurenine formamidase